MKIPGRLSLPLLLQSLGLKLVIVADDEAIPAVAKRFVNSLKPPPQIRGDDPHRGFTTASSCDRVSIEARESRVKLTEQNPMSKIATCAAPTGILTAINSFAQMQNQNAGKANITYSATPDAKMLATAGISSGD